MILPFAKNTVSSPSATPCSSSLRILNALWCCSGVTSKRLRLLQIFFDDIWEIWQASVSGLVEAGLQIPVAEKIISSRNKIDPDYEWDRLQKSNIRVISLEHPEYPRHLRAIPWPPALLYLRGFLPNPEDPILTMVGSRQLSSYGRQAINKFIPEIVSAGIDTVSGLAIGADSTVHGVTLQNGGTTIALLAHGLDQIHPSVNTGLAKEIVDRGGGLLSEYPLGTEPLRQRFPARNRLLAGFSPLTVIVEAGLSSGSLITAAMAQKYDRKVLVIPGSIFSPNSEGTNNLLNNEKIIALTNADQILHYLHLNTKSSQSSLAKSLPVDISHHRVYELLLSTPLSTDEIGQNLQIPLSQLLTIISEMELTGYIKKDPDNLWVTK